eukprot:gnl/MRDRNA2_/MRDRNA2_84891_c0_seq3.p1 gnl/MRDRNA2_/MRDRNA2_84891_c0~~gnl/MRDRNA2_/MRDRNA2_84891_c0_seq3.p1  ORF type:complete len:298 (+),score=94.89 gnl/MRDRNA2_/MRDRNA2_84891_c0_seq3:160-1053(+)
MQGGLYAGEHRKLKIQEEAWAKECERRKEAGEDEISFADWRKKQEDDDKAAKKKKEDEIKEAQKKEREAREASPEVQEQKRKSEVVTVGEDDLDEEDRKLLEETKKKGYYHGRLHSVPSNAAPTPQSVTEPQALSPEEAADTTGGSAWNAAGTWEDKDQSSWAKNAIQERLKAAIVKDGGGNTKAQVRRVTKCEGEASKVCVRGTNRYMYDFKASVDWKVSFPPEDGGDKPVEYRGKFNLPELSDAVPCEQLHCITEWTSSRPVNPSKVAEADDWLAKLEAEVRSQVALFVQEYQQR